MDVIQLYCLHGGHSLKRKKLILTLFFFFFMFITLKIPITPVYNSGNAELFTLLFACHNHHPPVAAVLLFGVCDAV
jgi:hypothetical protein